MNNFKKLLIKSVKITFFLLLASHALAQSSKPPVTYKLEPIIYNQIMSSLTIDFNDNINVVYDSTYSLGSVLPSNQLRILPVMESGQPWKLQFDVLEGYKPGKISFQIKKGGVADHIVELHIKAPKPTIDLVIIQNSTPFNEIYHDYRVPLKVSMKLSGGPFFEVPSVEFQDRKLEVRKISLTELEATLIVAGEELKKIKLGDQKLNVTHSDYGAVGVPVKVNGNIPSIESAKRISYIKKKSVVPVKITGSNISPNGVLCVKCIEPGSCYVEENCFSLKEHRTFGEVEAMVGLALPDHVVNTSFKVFIRNGDGQSSNEFTVRVGPTSETATIVARAENKPLVSGVTTEVIIGRISNDFPTRDWDNYQLFLNGDDIALPITVNSGTSTSDKLFAEITIPREKNGSNIKFKLSHGAQIWLGQIDQIIRQPQFVDERLEIRSNIEYDIYFDEKEEGATLTESQEGLNIIDRDISDGHGKFKLSNDFGDDQVKLSVNIKSHFLYSIELNVSDWDKPESTFDIKNELILDKQPIIKLEYGDNLIIEKSDQLVANKSSQSIKIQLYGKDGVAKGSEHILRFKNPEPLEIFPIGINTGEEFRVEFKTEDDQRKTYIGYIKRPPVERIMISAGLNGIKYKLKDDGDATTPRHNLLGGITVGAFYLLENKRPQDTRFIGFGIYGSFVENNNANDLQGSIGIGAILAEKLLIGFDFGKNKSFTIGANINILDFAKLVGATTEE